MSRSTVFQKHGFLLLPLLLLSLLFTTELTADQPPNIVMILADDLGWGDLRPDSQIDTPNLKKLAAEGVSLSRFYASASICSPTRAALLTGRYPHSVGVPELVSQLRGKGRRVLALNHSAVTIPEALDAADYTSVIVGKWHLGYDREDWPRTHGFDEFWGSLLGTPGYYDAKLTYHNETPIEVTGHYTDRLTDKAVELLKQHRGEPLFMYLAYNAPHYPLEAPAELVYKYRRKYKLGLFAIYAAMVEQLDSGIGRVLQTIEETGQTDNTLVVFTSDNGPSPEWKSYGPGGADISNGPLREWKFSAHEGGMRVPFIARWPGVIPPGTQQDQNGVTMDLLPTFLEAAGVTPAEDHEIHGQSLLPLLTGKRFDREGTLHWENQNNAAVMRGDWKLVHQFWQKPRLYNLTSDISESNNLSEEHPDRVTELLTRHEQWKREHYPNPYKRRPGKSAYAFPDWPTRSE